MLQQIVGGIDALGCIEIAASVRMMLVQKIAPGRVYLIRRLASHIDAEPPKQQDRVDDADRRQDFRGGDFGLLEQGFAAVCGRDETTPLSATLDYIPLTAFTSAAVAPPEPRPARFRSGFRGILDPSYSLAGGQPCGSNEKSRW